MYYHQQQQEENNLPKALGISTLVMAGLLLIGFFIVFAEDIPQYGMGGIIVNYGTSPEGMGDDYMSVEEPSMDENANQVRPDRIDENTTPLPTPTQQTAEKTVATQDIDDAPAVTKTEKPKPNNAEQSTVEKKNATPAVNQNALFKGKKNNGKGAGDGEGSTPGNQGSELGDPLASNYGEGGSGFGNMALSLSNRRWDVPPSVKDDGQSVGIVEVEFTVDKSGRIVRARQGSRTTIADYRLVQKCIQAVENAKLNSLANAPDSQVGKVTFRFQVR
ncbi:energy transducer TonB [Sphingobacterium corticis]|uniref:Energy transducer TonB n=1 Tax=Sphingobacterium corticis TaxID=1812823 RepID=A0ABW5NFI1_9SPHI